MPDRPTTASTPGDVPGRSTDMVLTGARGTVAPFDDRMPTTGDLPLEAGPLRDANWDRLPAAVTQRLVELAGERIEWWACRCPSPTMSAGVAIKAVVLGASGLVFATPTVDDSGRATHLVTAIPFAGDLRVSPVVFRPTLPRWLPLRRGRDVVPAAPLPPAPPGVTDLVEHVLATLPPRARDLLVAPFGTTLPVRESEHYYEGTPRYLEMFGLVLVGDRHVTMATGTRAVPPRHDERTAHWSLQVFRAGVARPAWDELMGR